jgi:5'-methylthioinosine phosphorylase
MNRLGLIGGTGLDHWGHAVHSHALQSKYGQPSATVAEFHVGNLCLYFLPRHGGQHQIPPHAVNYRANIDVLRQLGVTGIVAVNAVGGIGSAHVPGSIVIPDQLIDYTWGREHSFSLVDGDELLHVEFAEPFDSRIRKDLLRSANAAGISVIEGGCIAVAQGPRLETAAEILRFKRDGCDMVGMTSMPEAALAREAGLAYASLCVNANRAAGLGNEPVSMEAIEETLSIAMVKVRGLLASFFEEFEDVI